MLKKLVEQLKLFNNIYFITKGTPQISFINYTAGCSYTFTIGKNSNFIFSI